MRPRGLDLDRLNLLDWPTLSLLIIRCVLLVFLGRRKPRDSRDPSCRIPAASEVGRYYNDDYDHDQEEYDEDLPNVALFLLLLCIWICLIILQLFLAHLTACLFNIINLSYYFLFK